MNKQKYPNLFSPITLGNQLFRNRIFASPTGYQNLNGDGYLNDGAAAYYARKAKGGVASVASFEGVVDGELGRGGIGHIALDTPNIHNGLADVAYAVSRHGAVATLELQHTGMFANRDLSFFGASDKGIAYGPVECELDGRMIRAMDDEIIERTIKKFADGAAMAKRCGFGMVLIHAGHGWLLHQFLSPLTNTRKDKWGGAPIENRARIVIEICKAIRKTVGPGFPIELRMSGSECYDGGYDLDEGIAIAKTLDDYVDLLHISAGNHEIMEVFPVTHPSMFLENGVNVKYAAEIKKHVKSPVATIGSLNDAEMMEEIIASGKADVVEAARLFLCDPDFANKVRSGNEEDARKCLKCLSCFSSELTNGEPYCAINPETGRELELQYAIPDAEPKKVLVVGGGVAGMQAALTANERGHEVILCEKSGQLGGVLRCEKDVYFKHSLDYYLDQQARFVAESDIDLRLNTEVTEAYADEIGADVIIAALGARPIVPPIPGIEKQNVMAAEDAYTNLDQVGKNVVILGAGLVGVELGLHLIDNGKKVTVVEMSDHINDGGNFLHILGLNVEIARQGMEISFNTKAKEITETGVICETEEGSKTFDANTVIYAVGQKPLREEALAMNFSAPLFYQIGDCVTARNLTAANSEGFQIARDI